MPTETEFFPEGSGIPFIFPILHSWNLPATFLNIEANGSWIMYVIECAFDDSHTIIDKIILGIGIDIDEYTVRLVTFPTEARKRVKEVKKDESFEFEVTTRRERKGKIRITHR